VNALAVPKPAVPKLAVPKAPTNGPLAAVAVACTPQSAHSTITHHTCAQLPANGVLLVYEPRGIGASGVS
jgi:hypothetical protein